MTTEEAKAEIKRLIEIADKPETDILNKVTFRRMAWELAVEHHLPDPLKFAGHTYGEHKL